MMTQQLIRKLIREMSRDLEDSVIKLQGLVGAAEDGIWGPETQEKWTDFVKDINPDVVGASLDDLTYQWGWYASDISVVNGQPVSYTPDVEGALEFLHDIMGNQDLVIPVSSIRSDAPAAKKKDTSQKKVCLLGDSHIASQFGIALERKLKEHGFDVMRFGVGGASGRSWLTGNSFSKSPKTMSDVERGKPYDFAIICLGTNDGANAHVITTDPARLSIMAKESASKIREIATDIGAPVTFWVGPPGMTGKSENPHYQPEAMDHIYDAVGPMFPGTTFDSRHIDTGLGDHVHVYGSAADGWAQEVADFFMTQVL